MNSMISEIIIKPLTIETWDDFAALFGSRGACGNCWCMAFRLKKKDFEAGKMNDAKKNSMREIVTGRKPAGLLGFYQDKPVAWCAFAPREDFLRLEYSRVHKRIDDELVWSIPCMFIAKNYRKMGISVAFLKQVIEYAKNQNIKILEAYPVIPTGGRLPDAFAWIGVYSTFEKAGFKIVDRTSANRPMVRYYL